MSILSRKGTATVAAILAIIISAALIYAFIKVYLSSEESPIKNTNSVTGCDFKPSEDYGDCDFLLGAYYNGVQCVKAMGCGVGKDRLPFKSLEACQAECE